MPDEISPCAARAKQNDSDALEELFRINCPVLLGALIRITGNPRDVAGIAQETVFCGRLARLGARRFMYAA